MREVRDGEFFLDGEQLFIFCDMTVSGLREFFPEIAEGRSDDQLIQFLGYAQREWQGDPFFDVELETLSDIYFERATPAEAPAAAGAEQHLPE